MARFVQSVFFILFAFLNGSAFAQSNDDNKIYIFGVYEGLHEKSQRDAPHRGNIDLDNISHPTTLVLVSYHPMEWQITTPNSSLIKKIILGGYGVERSSVSINEKLEAGVSRYKDLPTAYRKKGNSLRKLLRALENEFGFEKFDGFSGSYRAPEEGFKLSSVEKDNPQLGNNFLDHLLAKPSDLPNIQFEANIRNQFALYNLSGQKVGPAVEFKDQNSLAASDGNLKIEITRSGFYLSDLKIDKDSYILLPEGENFGEEPTSFMGAEPKALILNTKQQRILGVWSKSWADHFFLQYDIKTSKWLTFTRLKYREPTSLIYDPQSDHYVMSFKLHGGYERGNGVLILNTDGNVILDRFFKSTSLPGFTDLYDASNRGPVPLQIAHSEGSWIVLTASEQQDMPLEKSTNTISRMYLYNTDENILNLTYYDKNIYN